MEMFDFGSGSGSGMEEFCPEAVFITGPPPTGMTLEITMDPDLVLIEGGGLAGKQELLNINMKYSADPEAARRLQDAAMMPKCEQPDLLDFVPGCTSPFSCAGATFYEFVDFALHNCTDLGTKNMTEIEAFYESADCNMDGLLTTFEFKAGPCFCFIDGYPYPGGWGSGSGSGWRERRAQGMGPPMGAPGGPPPPPPDGMSFHEMDMGMGDGSGSGWFYEPPYVGICPLFGMYNETRMRRLFGGRKLQEGGESMMPCKKPPGMGYGIPMGGGGSGSGSGSGWEMMPPPCVMAPGVCCPNNEFLDYIRCTPRFAGFFGTAEGLKKLAEDLEFNDGDSNGCLDHSEQVFMLDYMVQLELNNYDAIKEKPGVASGVRQVANSMHTSGQAATKTPKLSYALEGMQERMLDKVGASDANQDGVVTQREATNKQFDPCEVDFSEADQAGGNIDKMLTMDEAKFMFAKLHEMEFGSAQTLVYIRDGSDGSPKDDVLSMSELCKPLEQILETGSRGMGSGSGSGSGSGMWYYRERTSRALQPMFSLIEDRREMKKERRALMVAKKYGNHKDGDDRRLEVLNEAISDKHFNRFSYSVMKKYRSHAQKQRRLTSSRRLQEKFPDLVIVPDRRLDGPTAGGKKRGLAGHGMGMGSGLGSGMGLGMDMGMGGGCHDMSAADIATLNPP